MSLTDPFVFQKELPDHHCTIQGDETFDSVEQFFSKLLSTYYVFLIYARIEHNKLQNKKATKLFAKVQEHPNWEPTL